MIIDNLTPAQRVIIQRICIIQLDSLRRLLHDESEMDLDITMYLLEKEVSRDEYDDQLMRNITKFTILNNKPDDLRVLDKKDQSKFRHLLARIEDEYSERYPQAISNLWQRIFLLEDINKMEKMLRKQGILSPTLN